MSALQGRLAMNDSTAQQITLINIILILYDTNQETRPLAATKEESKCLLSLSASSAGTSILLKPSVFVHSPSPEVTPITENSPTENEKDVVITTHASSADTRGENQPIPKLSRATLNPTSRCAARVVGSLLAVALRRIHYFGFSRLPGLPGTPLLSDTRVDRKKRK